MFSLSRLTPGDHEEAARLIHGSLSAYYAAKLNQPGRFGVEWEPFLVFPEVYEQLDAGCGICVRQGDGDGDGGGGGAGAAGAGKLLGVCYYHPRPTHISVGIVATHPERGGGGVARRMLEEVLALADAEGKEVRLVSSLMNLDSFSLYTKLGFVPGEVFQDVQFPAGRRLEPGAMAGRVRVAEMRDVPAMVALEMRLCGIDRTQDFDYFLRNAEGCWRVLVMENAAGGLSGFLGSIRRETT
ncbi:MAG: Acetyltransferase [Verrucomicrobiales bacterium]|nr:Acetyltransferase [Verrucomicrobiales bacterium]